MTETFSIKVGEFDGPLPQLLELVEKRRLPISQVSLAQVADDFLAYVRGLGQPSMAVLAEFLVIASTLMLIKSLSLLPSLALSSTENEEIDNLERRLKLYQVVKKAALELRKRFGQQLIFYPESRAGQIAVFSPSDEIISTNLLVTMKNLIASWPADDTAPLPRLVVKKIVSLEEMIENLAGRVQNALKLNFSEFVKNQTADWKKEKVNIIVSFLALLELCKQGVVAVEQSEHFSDIVIETRATETPRY